jgi:hypothetical protein
MEGSSDLEPLDLYLLIAQCLNSMHKYIKAMTRQKHRLTLFHIRYHAMQVVVVCRHYSINGKQAAHYIVVLPGAWHYSYTVMCTQIRHCCVVVCHYSHTVWRDTGCDCCVVVCFDIIPIRCNRTQTVTLLREAAHEKRNKDTGQLSCHAGEVSEQTPKIW